MFLVEEGEKFVLFKSLGLRSYVLFSDLKIFEVSMKNIINCNLNLKIKFVKVKLFKVIYNIDIYIYVCLIYEIVYNLFVRKFVFYEKCLVRNINILEKLDVKLKIRFKLIYGYLIFNMKMLYFIYFVG